MGVAGISCKVKLVKYRPRTSCWGLSSVSKTQDFPVKRFLNDSDPEPLATVTKARKSLEFPGA